MSANRFYVDASVIAGLALGDIAFDDFVAIIGAEATLTYSDFGFGEAVAALSARSRAARLDDDHALARTERLRAFLDDWTQVGWFEADLSRAIVLVGRASLALKLPDAIHVAIAERIDVPLLSADRQQCAAAEKIGMVAKFTRSGRQPAGG